MTRPAPWPTTDDEDRLLDLLRSGDAAAVGDFAAAFRGPLAAAVAAKHRWADPDWVESAATNALVGFLKRPGAFDRTIRSLRGYLLLAGERKLFTIARRERKHRDGRVPFPDAVEDRRAAGNTSSEGPGWGDPRIVAALAALAPADRTVFDLMLAGVRDTATYVGPLGLTADPPRVQARRVKRAKERVFKRLGRAVRGKS